MSVSWWQHRTLLKAFIKRDIYERFAGSILGPLGLFIQPLVQIIVFIFLFKYIFKVRIHIGGGMDEDFLRFFLAAFIPWTIHNEAFLRGANSLLTQGYLLTKAAFPAEIIPFSSVVSSYILGITALFFLSLIFYFYGGLSWSILWVPELLILQFLFTLGATLFWAAIIVYLRDLQQFLGLVSMVWFYATPILYSLEMLPHNLYFIFWLNPFTYFVRLWQFIYLGIPCSSWDFILSCIFTAITLFLGWTIFRYLKAGFADIL